MIVRHCSFFYKGLAILVILTSVVYLLRFYFSARTAYPFFASKTSYFLNANLDSSPLSVPGCTPVLFWFVSRHGSRNPDKNEIAEMIRRMPGIRDTIVTAWQGGGGEMEEDVIQMLKKWKLAPKIEDEMKLSDSGGKEQEEMGRRWRKRLMNLLEDPKKILVRATNFERTRESAKFFLKGVFEKELLQSPNNLDLVKVQVSPEKKKDKVLRFFENCPRYAKDIIESNKTTAESHALEQCNDYGDMLDNVRAKAGVNLSSSDVWWIWEICRFEMAWWPLHNSPWCQLFSKNNLQILEYKEDLNKYYSFAYGNDINWQMTQPMFSDIFTKFEQAHAGKSNLTGVLYFAHAETMGPLLAALGLYHDKNNLHALDWPNDGYKWRSSHIISFSANVGLVLLRCGTDLEEGEEEEWKVMALHQEKRVKLPACQEDLCSLGEFTKYYGQLENINFKDLCHI